jgi:hypothetical protein
VGDSATLRVRSAARLPPPVPGRAPTAVGSPAAHTEALCAQCRKLAEAHEASAMGAT